MTPFQALYGRLPPTIPSYNEGLSSVHEVDQQLQDQDELLQQLKVNLARSVNRMKQIANQKQKDVSFEVGDLMLLKLHPYRQQIVFQREYQKLACRFYGPYEILEKIGPVAYKLHLPAESRIHPIFHISLLKRYNTNTKNGKHITEIPSFSEDGEVILTPQAVIDHRWIKQGARIVKESLVHWKYLPVEEATWVSTKQLLELFPDVDLGYKVPHNEGGSDKPRRSARPLKPNPKYIC